MTRLLIVMVAVWVALGAMPARAQEAVAVRTGSHDGYQRLVFDWPLAPVYTIKRDGAALALTFTRPGTVDEAKIEALENIQDVRVTSKAGENLSMTLRIPEKSAIRDLKVGSRVIVDVYDPPGGRVKPEPAPAPEEKPAPKPADEPAKEEPKAAPKPEEKAPAPTVKEEAKPEPKTKTKTEPAPAPTPKAEEKTDAPPAVQAAEQTQAPAIQPHVITVTSTKPLGLAAFTRGDWLWIVGDAPMEVPPALSGPQVDSFGLMQRFELPGGTAYRLKKPQGVGITAEGGGLRWRIVLSPNSKDVAALQPERLSPVAGDKNKDMPRKGAALRFALEKPKTILHFQDPDIGDEIRIVTQEVATTSARVAYGFVELETLPSYIGLAFLPLADDIEVTLDDDGARIGRGQEDLSLSMGAVTGDGGKTQGSSIEAEEPPPVNANNLYHFARWRMGGAEALLENEAVLMADMAPKKDEEKIDDLMILAKLMLANHRGAEALGYLRTAAQIRPAVADRAEFIGLRGAAYLMMNQPDLAIADLVNPALDQYQDIPYWRMKAYAELEDWQQAIKTLPKDVKAINDYPPRAYEHLSLSVAEVALRAGQVMEAERILANLEPAAGDMKPADRAAWHYLMGETARQLKQYEKSKEYWQKLAKGRDDYYRVRAGLALTRLLGERNEIDPVQAIDRLEGLRYAWRGDELEALTNYRLGRLYIENKDYPKGLYVLRNAASLAPDSQLSREVTAYMTQAFRQLFDSEDLQTVSPLDAISVYEEFKELMPTGAEGDRIVDQLAERMVDSNLLARAESLFAHQLAHRLKGVEAARVALRLAAIRLLSNKPEAALKNLAQAESLYQSGNDQTVPPDKMREITLLRASALAKSGQADKAIDEIGKLPPDKIVARLKADIAWKSQRWREAADGLDLLIQVEQIRPDQPLTSDQADLILNRGIALNLAGDRVGLGMLRDRYTAQMAQTPKAELFDVVTLPRRFGLIRSRDTIAETINNVDLFKDFLESYRKADVAPSAGETAGSASAPTEPASETPDAAAAE